MFSTLYNCIEVGVTARPAFEDVDVLVISQYFKTDIWAYCLHVNDILGIGVIAPGSLLNHCPPGLPGPPGPPGRDCPGSGSLGLTRALQNSLRLSCALAKLRRHAASLFSYTSPSNSSSLKLPLESVADTKTLTNLAKSAWFCFCVCVFSTKLHICASSTPAPPMG